MTQTVATLARPRHQRLLHDSLLVAAHDLGDKPAIVTKEARLSYAELLDQAARLAHALQEQGLERGDRVAIFMDNTASCCVSIFGTLLAGGVFMRRQPADEGRQARVHPRRQRGERSCSRSRASRATAATCDRGQPHAQERPLGRRRRDGVDERVRDFQEAIDAAEPAPADPGTIPVDLAALIYTSGSTGNPKGVMLTHANMVFAAGSISEYLRLSADDRILSVLPLAFDYGLYQLLMAVRLGATLALERSFVFPAETLKRLDEEEITVFPGVPTVYATLLGMKGERTLPERHPADEHRCRPAAGLPRPPARALPERAHLPHVRPHRVQARQLSRARARAREADLGRQGDPRHRDLRARRRRPPGRARRDRRPLRPRPARDGRLLAAARAHRGDAQGRPRAGREDALHPRLLHGGRGRLPLLPRPQRRHHQDARREGEPARGRERALRDRRHPRGGRDRRRRRACSARRSAPTSRSRTASS